MEIKVLWIDDQPNNAFIDRADKEGIYIEVFKNVDSGINELLNSKNSYDAIILDANCLSHDDGSNEPDVTSLGYALRMITKNNIVLPWFVYSGGGFSGEESISIIVKGYEREYDNKDWYKKPTERNELFAKIKEVVPNSADYIIKSKYPEIFSWYPNVKELLDIVKYYEYNKSNDADVFNKIRKELDWIMKSLYEYGLLQEPYKGSNLGECSAFLGKNNLQSLVPLHIQRSFHSTTSICNEGSHRLVIDELVKSGKAPHLVKSTILEFLNILYWMKDMPKSPEGMEYLKALVEELLKEGTSDEIEKYEGKDFVVEQDEKNNFHCGQCRLSYKAAQGLKGKTVTLYNVTVNDAKSKDNYPLFAKFCIKENKQTSVQI